jgi:hypothetical protein
LGGGEGSSSSSSHPGGGGGGAADDVAAAAEHHRLNSLSSSVDLRAAGIALERGLPYAALLLILFISTHVVVSCCWGCGSKSPRLDWLLLPCPTST